MRKEGELLQNYYAIGHASLDNYIAQVSGQAPTADTGADCSDSGFAFANVTPGTPAPDTVADPGQVTGQGCVYPASVQTIASQLDAKYPPNPHTHVASWRAYEQDMGNTPSRDGGTLDLTGGTDCGHPAIGTTDTAEVATPADQYTTRHNPFVWFHSVIDNTALCDANVVPLGTLGANGTPAPSGHLAHDLKSEATTPRFGFITPNLCNDGHDGTCAGPNSTGGNTGGLTGADQFLHAWMPLILSSPAYRHGDMLVVITFDEAEGTAADTACCNEQSGPNSSTTGGGPGRRPAPQRQVHRGGVHRHHRLLQPLLRAAQLRGPARADLWGDGRQGAPRLRGSPRAPALRHRRVPGPPPWQRAGRDDEEDVARLAAVSPAAAAWPGSASRSPRIPRPTI